MTDTAPARLSSRAEIGLQRRTLLARCIAARDAHQYALAFVGAFGEEEETGAGDILAARRLSMLVQRYRVLAVLTARIVRGATWPQVAAALGVEESMARGMYADVESRWRAGDPAPWNPQTAGGAAMRVAPPIVIDPARIDDVAAELDGYFAAHTDDPDERPCTSCRACTARARRRRAVTGHLPG